MKAEDIKIIKEIYEKSSDGRFVTIKLKNGEVFKATAVNYTEIDTETEEDVIAVRVLRKDGKYDTLAGEWIEDVEE